MAMQFGMMFPVGQDQGSGTAWEFRLRPIALRYLKGWFIIDVFTIGIEWFGKRAAGEVLSLAAGG